MILLYNLNKLKPYIDSIRNTELKNMILNLYNLNILFPNDLLSIAYKNNLYLEKVIIETDIDKFLHQMFDIIDEKHKKINCDDFDLEKYYIILPLHLIYKNTKNIIFIMKNFTDSTDDKIIKIDHIFSVLNNIINLPVNKEFSLSSLENEEDIFDEIIIFNLNEYFSTDFYKKMILGYKMVRIKNIIKKCIKNYDSNNVLIITYTLNNLNHI
jgi:hypothetical protein